MAAKQMDDRKPVRDFTVAEFEQLNSKAASIRKQLDADRLTVGRLSAEIKNRTTLKTVMDPSNRDAKIQKSTPLRPAEVAPRRAERDQLLLKIAKSTTELKEVEKNLRSASKQISADAREGAAVTRAKFSASLNPERYFRKMIKKFLEKGDGKMSGILSQFRKEWANDPAAIRKEVLETIKEHFPMAHRLIIENPELEQFMFAIMLDDDAENKK